MGARLARLLLRLFGWTLVWAPPPGPKSVVIAYPHTSNWDFPLTLLWRFATGFPLHWAGKDTMFDNPLGGLFRRWGGVPVNRRERTGLIGQLCREYAERDTFHLAIAPEGTRKRTDHLKSGFYRLALAAGVPVGLGFIDYRTRTLGIGCWLTLTGDEAADLDTLRAFYADKTPLRPAQAGDIRFRD